MAVVVAICALVGALAGIAGSAAAPSKKSKSNQAQKKAQNGARERGFHPRPLGLGGPPLHSESVVPNRDGTDFLTIVTDSGTLLSVDGTTVHLKQATEKATYKADAAIDVGDNAKVFRNGGEAKLSDLEQDDHVHVIKGGPDGTVVLAHDDSFRPRMHRHHRHRGFGPGAPPPPAGPNG